MQRGAAATQFTVCDLLNRVVNQMVRREMLLWFQPVAFLLLSNTVVTFFFEKWTRFL